MADLDREQENLLEVGTGGTVSLGAVGEPTCERVLCISHLGETFAELGELVGFLRRRTRDR
jgi:hypothetical protein